MHCPAASSGSGGGGGDLIEADRALLPLEHALVAALVAAARVHQAPLLPLVERQAAARADVGAAGGRGGGDGGRGLGAARGHQAADGAQICKENKVVLKRPVESQSQWAAVVDTRPAMGMGRQADRQPILAVFAR